MTPRTRLLSALAATALTAATLAAGPARAEPFTLFIYETEADIATRTDPAKAQAYWGAFMAYANAMGKAGVLRGGMPLQPASHARVSTVRDGRVSVRTGARATAPDQLGGFFMIDVPDLEAALAWAAKAPSAVTGAVEVRPGFPAPAMN